MMLTGSIGKETPGVKKRISQLLEAIGTNSLSMGEIIDRLGIDKTLAAEVSSALYKLHSQGLVERFDGPASSELGRRVVRRYRWIIKPVPVPPPAPVAYDPRRMLGIRRV